MPEHPDLARKLSCLEAESEALFRKYRRVYYRTLTGELKTERSLSDAREDMEAAVIRAGTLTGRCGKRWCVALFSLVSFFLTAEFSPINGFAKEVIELWQFFDIIVGGFFLFYFFERKINHQR
jgi:hypothetical protein